MVRSNFLTVLSYRTSEIVIDKSRFISHVFPVDNEEDINRYINIVKKKYYNATHNVVAYKCGDIKRANDDGEPSGTSAMPMLEFIEKAGYDNVLVVSTRYFGGIKLGKGGLARAYSESAKTGVESEHAISVKIMNTISLTLDYSFYDYILRMPNIHIRETVFGERIQILLNISSESTDDFISYLTNLSNGQIEIVMEEAELLAFSLGKLLGSYKTLIEKYRSLTDQQISNILGVQLGISN